MLRKSLKHEFRATARIMLPIFLGLLLLSVAAHFCGRVLDRFQLPWYLTTLNVIVIVLFVVGIIAAAVSVVALTVVRFYRSFLSNEGYLNMTLPVSVHTHISSRLIVSVVWYTLGALAIIASVAFAVLDISSWRSIFSELAELIEELNAVGYTGRVVVLGLEAVVCAVAGCAFISLMLYAAMSIGHSFNKGKKGLSVLFAFLFYHALQILGIFSIVAISRFNWDSVTMKMSDPAYMFSFAQGAMGVGFLVTAILCTVFYFVTHYFLSKRLNLE